MNYEKACEILEISQKHLDDDVKKAYFRMALRYHPDKYKEDDGEKFKEIKLAYDFLTDNRRVHKIEIDENIDYKELIKMCMKYFSPDTKWDSLFVDTSFIGIMKDCQRISLKIFEKLNKDKAKQVYDFLYKFNYVLGIDEELLSKYRETLQKKMVYDNIIILNPLLKDLINDNIFKLDVDDKEFYVPLWHHELHFSLQDKDLIVRCEPEIPENVWINERNDIYLTIQISINELFEKGFHEFEVGEKLIKIESESLKITKEKQIVLLKEKGILKINEEHTYDASVRGDIYLEVFLI
jgi:curved DNA-binding protein CbpA